ncbi:unnamed protein product, partial [Closterium sp. NIES-65]
RASPSRKARASSSAANQLASRSAQVGLNAALVPSLTPVSPLKRAARRSSGTTRCSAAPQAPSAAKEVAEEGSGSKGFGVFRLTYDLKEIRSYTPPVAPSLRVLTTPGGARAAQLEQDDPRGGIGRGGHDLQPLPLQGVAMELEDSLFPLLREVSISIDARTAFADVDWALLIGAKPRAARHGARRPARHQRPDLRRAVRSSCLKNAPKLNPRNFHALTKLDENRRQVPGMCVRVGCSGVLCAPSARYVREGLAALGAAVCAKCQVCAGGLAALGAAVCAKCQLALKAGVFYDKISNMTIWATTPPPWVFSLGFPPAYLFLPVPLTFPTSSPHQVPDFVNARILGFPATDVIGDRKWLEEQFTPQVQTEVLSRMSEEVLSRMSEEVLSRMSEEVLSRMSEEVLSRVSEEVLSRVSEERGGALIKKWGQPGRGWTLPGRSPSLSTPSTLPPPSGYSVRGGALIKKWGRSSAASTAVSLVDAIRALTTPTPEGDWFSTGVYTKGNTYGIDDDLIFSLPCRSKGGASWKQRWRPRQLQCRRPVVRLFPFCTSLHSNFPPPFSPYHAFLPTFPCTPFPVCGWQGDGDYEVVSGLIVDDYLRARINKSEVVVVRESEVVVVRESEVVVVRESEVVVVRESEVVVVRESEVVVVRESEVVVVREKSEVVVVRESEVVVVRESEVVVVRESEVVVVRESEVVVVRESEVVVVRESEVVVVRESEVVVVRESEVVVVRESEVVVVRESEVVVVRESEVVVVRESEVVVVRESEVVVE